MATTTNYGFEIPDDTDLVKDGALAMRDLGQDVDTAMFNALAGQKAGLILINTTSFSAVASVTLPAGSFSSTYNDYLLLVNFTGASANLNLTGRMRSGVTDATTAYDAAGVQYVTTGSGLTALNTAGGTSWDLGQVNSTSPSYSQLSILFKSPNTTNPNKPAFITGNFVSNAGAGTGYVRNVAINLSTQFDTFKLIASTGNFTGNCSVYGYNK
jgi:hypothetical protein